MKNLSSPLPTFSPDITKDQLYRQLKQYVTDALKLQIEDENFKKPWGGYFVIAQSSLPDFLSQFFPDHQLTNEQQLSPKFLVVAPHKRLSWQYHHKRAEVWTILQGPVGVCLSETDEECEPEIVHQNEKVVIAQGLRHRLEGLDNWGIVAEIWQHVDPSEPSNEDDIVRVADDFGRNLS